MRRALDPLKVAEFRRTAERLQQERAAAVPVVRMIRRMIAARMSVSLPAEWVTVGVREKLSEAFRELLPHAPAEARALPECALAVAGRLDGSYLANVRAATVATAWADLAMADYRNGDPAKALQSLDRADDALRGHPSLGHDQAIVDMTRATALHALGRDEEALALLGSARRSFDELGDERRVAECERMRGAITSG